MVIETPVPTIRGVGTDEPVRDKVVGELDGEGAFQATLTGALR